MSDGLANVILESAKSLCEEHMAREGADAYPSSEFMMEVARIQARAANDFYGITPEAAKRMEAGAVGKASSALRVACNSMCDDEIKSGVGGCANCLIGEARRALGEEA